jgi:Sir2- and TIR-associating SLOG family/SIR2-like domain
MGASDWKPSSEQRSFIRQYAKAVEGGDAAAFIGAGFSRAAGYVDWKGLLKEIAEDLGLSLDRESDLVAVAQYHFNKKQNRAKLNQALIDEFTKTTTLTRNHYLLARLPIDAIWTTNYDELIERSFEAAGKIVDVKVTQENLAQSKRGRDVVVYKMHGTVAQPQDAVLTKDDYESYGKRRSLFVENLKGDLISKTFLFLGFSFSDPNIDYVLSRIRVLLDTNQREHFAIMRRPERPKRVTGRLGAEYEYEQRKLDLRIGDLRRFAIETVLIDDYSEIEALLEAVSAYAHRKNVFISGSAREFGAYGKDRLEELSRTLGRRLIEEGFNLVSGFGVGIGEHCVVSALKALYAVQKGREVDRVLIRPFPRSSGAAAHQRDANLQHREDLISRSGVVVFLAGNRAGAGGVTEHSFGVREEFEVAKRLKRFVIPVGATGFVAKELWDEVVADVASYFPGLSVRSDLDLLADPGRSPDEHVEAVVRIVRATITAREV